MCGSQAFSGKVPRPLLWAGSLAARGKITVNGKPNRLHYYVIFYSMRGAETWTFREVYRKYLESF